MITFSHQGNFDNAERFLKKMKSRTMYNKLRRYGKEGVEALRRATPKDTGLTANSWSYKVTITKSDATISWSNSNFNKGVPIALVLQYGHGTGTGGYVKGIDYINPAMKPIFERIINDIWKEVTK